MANPVEFPESNIKFGKPGSMTAAECGDLPCYFNGEQIVSCWQLTPEELEEINSTGVVWIMVWGQGTPPICVIGNRPFEEVQENGEGQNTESN